MRQIWQSSAVKKSEKTAMTETEGSPLFDLTDKRVYVAGHMGMVGAALVRRLRSEPCKILTVDRAALDLTRYTEHWIGIRQRRLY